MFGNFGGFVVLYAHRRLIVAEKKELIPASPTKRFFVEMLTRDIALEDAILDLLDNCVDGAVRSQKVKEGDLRDFSGYKAEITFNRDSFVIADNCGGIPLDAAKDYAFRMGRPESADGEGSIPTVGVYGIGMKRALFRLGRRADVSWRIGDGGNYRVRFDERWLAADSNWDLSLEGPLSESALKTPGTRVAVQRLHPPIAKMLMMESFTADLTRRIESLYSYILDKGFRVVCNGTVVEPRPLKILDASALKKGARIEPYIYKDEIDGVKIFVAVGLTRPLLSEAETEKEHFRQRKSGEAGITVICNDRVVLHNDRTSLTGWGELAPAYHTQFINIGGFAQFSCNDAIKLPLTTTKRGIDESSAVYAKAKLKMGEGLKIFTDYTNKWKKSLAQEQAHSRKAAPMGIAELASRVAKRGTTTSKPRLPTPPKSPSEWTTISQFRRSKGQVAKVSNFLFGNPHESAAKVGEASFDYCLEQAEESEEE